MSSPSGAPEPDDSNAEIPESLHAADSALRTLGFDAARDAWDLLNGIGDGEAGAAPIAALRTQTGLPGDQVERLLLWAAGRRSLPRVPGLPVIPSIREHLQEEMRQLHALKPTMLAGSYDFTRAAKLATLRRFPAGPLEWEISGIPRSYLLQPSFPAKLQLLSFVAFRVGGWAPCFFTHVSPAPRNRGLRVAKLVLRSYHQMIRSMELQPSARALVAHAWFHDPAAVRDYPHLDVLSRPFLDNGGSIVLLKPATVSSGVLEGNAQRKADYIAGKVQYRYGLAIWPRKAAIRWARAHPEFAE